MNTHTHTHTFEFHATSNCYKEHKTYGNSLEKTDINSTRSSLYKNDLQPHNGLEKETVAKNYCNSPLPFASPLVILM